MESLIAQGEGTAVNGLEITAAGTHSHAIRVYSSSGRDSIDYIYGSENSDFIKNGIIATNYQASRTYTKNASTIQNDGSHTHPLTGDTETRPINYTVKVWKRVS